MSRVGSISIVLLLMVASSVGYYTRSSYGKPSRTYRRPYGSGYGSSSVYGSGYGSSSVYGSGYGSGYGSSSVYGSGYGSTYKKTYNAVSKAPLCKANGRIMLRLYIEDGGTPVSNAKVNYVDNKLIDTVSTDLYGYIAIPVYGCTVALIVYRKDGNPVFKTVDLLSCTTREEKVVLDLDDKCNFELQFAHKGHGTGTGQTACTSCGDENQLVSYFYKSDDHTGYGQAVAGTPACITAGDEGDELIVQLKTQYSNMYNVLNITITDNDLRFAAIALPPQLDESASYDETNFDIVLISNTFEDDMEYFVNMIDSWELFPKTGSTIEMGDPDTITDVSSFSVEAGKLKDDKWLLAVQFETSEDDTSTDVDLEGNVVVIDCDGNYQSVEHPDSDGDDYAEEVWFLVGCFCNNAPSMKEGDFISIGKYVTGDETPGDVTDISDTPYATHCHQLCVNNS